MKKIFTTDNITTFGLTILAMIAALAIWPHVRNFIPGAKKAAAAGATVTPTAP